MDYGLWSSIYGGGWMGVDEVGFSYFSPMGLLVWKYGWALKIQSWVTSNFSNNMDFSIVVGQKLGLSFLWAYLYLGS